MLEKKKPNVPLLLKDCIYLYASLSPSFPSFFFFIHILCIWLAFYLISELFRAKYDLSYSKDISTITYKYLFLSLDKHLKMKFKKIKIRFWLLSGFNHRQVWTNFHPWFVSLFSSSSASFSFFFWYNFYFKEWVTNPSCSGIMYSFLGFFYVSSIWYWKNLLIGELTQFFGLSSEGGESELLLTYEVNWGHDVNSQCFCFKLF